MKNSLSSAPARGLAVIAFGRMAPVTVGHRKLAFRLRELAEERGGTARLYLSRKYDGRVGRPLKRPAQARVLPQNPLRYEDKLRFVRDAVGDLVSVESTSHTDVFDVLRTLSREGYSRVLIVGGADIITRPFSRYNGTEYTFDSIEVMLGGERSAESADFLETVSATQAREAAYRGDFATFERLVATKTETPALWTILRRELGVA